MTVPDESPGGDTAHAAFLRGDRPDDILCYLPDETVSEPESLAAHGHRVDGGTVLVVPGDRGRALLDRIAGIDPMALATRAADAPGAIARDCTGGQCPTEPSDGHHLRLLFAFAEPQTEAAGGRYAEGDVVHAYAVCSCGTTYADRWIVEA